VAFLALPELLLRLPALGDVPRVGHYPLHGRIIQEVGARGLHVAPGAVLVAKPYLRWWLNLTGFFKGLGKRALHSAPVLRVDVIEGFLPNPLFGVVA
jgi:hypothetical protein